MDPPFSSMWLFAQVLSRAGHARSLMEGLDGPPSDQPFVTPAARRPRSREELAGSGGDEGFLLRVARTTTTHTGTDGRSRAGRAACCSQPGNNGDAGGPDLTGEVIPLGLAAGVAGITVIGRLRDLKEGLLRPGRRRR